MAIVLNIYMKEIKHWDKENRKDNLEMPKHMEKESPKHAEYPKTWKAWKNIEMRIRTSDLYNTSTLKSKSNRKDEVYGELSDSFTMQLAGMLDIKKGEKLVDVGSGIGLFGIAIAAYTQCRV